jgi:hypothetical protein
MTNRSTYSERFVVPSGRDPCLDLGTAGLRVHTSLNLFKRLLLGSDHDPSRPQVAEVFNKLAMVSGEFESQLTDRTWSRLWARGTSMKKKTAKALDEAAANSLRRVCPRDGVAYRLPDGFFEAMARGGAMRSLAQVNDKRNLRKVRDALDAGEPRSAWHVYLDACEAAALDAATCSHAKALLAGDALWTLNDLWNRRDGSVYKWLSDRERPNWGRLHVPVDAPIRYACLTMLSLVDDSSFLVGDRLAAWAWDLAGATLATEGFLACDVQHSFTGVPTDVFIVWKALRRIFFDDRFDLARSSAVTAAIAACGYARTPTHISILRQARAAHQEELAALAIKIEDLRKLIDGPPRASVARKAGRRGRAASNGVRSVGMHRWTGVTHQSGALDRVCPPTAVRR